jgi:hypothetical protein
LASSTRSGSTPQCSDAKNRPVRPIPVWISSATPGRLAQIILARDVDALALDRLDHERCHVAPREDLLESRQIVERDRRAGTDERSEPLPKRAVAAQRHGAVGQAVERMLAMHDPGSAGRRPAELDRGLDRLGTGAAKEQLLQPRHVAGKALGQQTGEQRDVELDQTGELAAQHLLERVDHGRMVASEGEDPEPAQQIEVAVAVGVEQVSPLGAHVVHGEPERAQDPHQLRIEMTIEQGKLVGASLLDQSCHIDRHQGSPHGPKA